MKKRINIIFISFCIMIGALIARLGILSTSSILSEASNKQSSYRLNISETRANIYDKNYYQMVNEDSEYKISFLPTPENIDNILDELNLSNRGIIINNMRKQLPVILTTNQSYFYNQDIKLFETIKRYGKNQLASHIIGYIDGEKKGISGIEKSYDTFLNEYKKITEIAYYKNGIGKTIKGAEPKIVEDKELTEGVVLTLDKSIQKIVEKIGNKYIKKGAIVMMDPYTGKIIASASFPSYDPNDIKKSINDEENSPMINRVLNSYSVGSTFKIAISAAALESGISEDFTVNCKGYIYIKDQKFKCHNLNGHGIVNMERALSESCNPYFIEIANKINPKKILTLSKALGFSKQTELTPNIISSKGVLPSEKDLINTAEMANFSFGQGKLLATPIQISQMLSSIINEGKTPIPRLIEGLTLDGKTLFKKEEPKSKMVAMNKETANKIKNILIKSISERKNQYAKPKLTNAGGKTSTAQTGVFIDDKEILQTWFSGFFPAENPRYVCTILVENGETGNISSGPIFSEIADEVIILEK